MNKHTTVEISPKTVLFVVVLLVGLVVAWQIRTIIIALGVSLILMSGFAPLVDWLVKNKINRTVAVAATYILAIFLLGTLLFVILPPLIEETRQFVLNFPDYVGKISKYLDVFGVPHLDPKNMTEILVGRINSLLGNALSLILNVFTGFLTFISVAVFSFYLLLERDKIKKNLFVLFPNLPKEDTLRITQSIETKLGAWVRGEIFLMFMVGLASWIGLSLLGVPYALPLAVIAGLMEVVPVIGPIISAFPAMIVVAASGGGFLGILGVAALYTLIQQVENYLLVPAVMKEVVGLSPLVTILSLLIGGSLFGIVGAVVAVPAAAVAQVIVLHWRDINSLKVEKNSQK